MDQRLHIIDASRSHLAAPQSGGLLGRVINSTQGPVPDTQHSQVTNIHAPGGIQTHNPSKRTALELTVTGILITCYREGFIFDIYRTGIGARLRGYRPLLHLT